MIAIIDYDTGNTRNVKKSHGLSQHSKYPVG